VLPSTPRAFLAEEHGEFSLAAARARCEDPSVEFLVLPHNAIRGELRDFLFLVDCLGRLVAADAKDVEEAVAGLFTWWDGFAGFLVAYLSAEETSQYPVIKDVVELEGDFHKSVRIPFKKQLCASIEVIDGMREKEAIKFKTMLERANNIRAVAMPFAKHLMNYIVSRERAFLSPLESFGKRDEIAAATKAMAREIFAGGSTALSILVRPLAPARRTIWLKDKVPVMQRLLFESKQFPQISKRRSGVVTGMIASLQNAGATLPMPRKTPSANQNNTFEPSAYMSYDIFG